MCLLIGPPGVGKTLLMKRMQNCTSKGTFENLHEIPATIPTFMIDLNNRQQVSAACIQLLTVLQDKQLMNIPVLILLNKIDLGTVMPRPEFENYLRLEEILQHSTQRITVHEMSAWSGQGLEEIFRWLQANYKAR